MERIKGTFLLFIVPILFSVVLSYREGTFTVNQMDVPLWVAGFVFGLGAEGALLVIGIWCYGLYTNFNLGKS